jgi:acetyl esterase/lipase
MKHLVSPALLLSALFASCAARAAEPIVLDLWPGKVPGDVGIEGQERTFVVQSKIPHVGDQKLITNVTKPTLTIYSPPKEKNTGTALIICPGGGYHNLYWVLEGEEVAQMANSLGMTGIILKYRCPRRPGDVRGIPPLGPTLDAQRAISLVRSRAAELGINPKRIGMVGFSAGGHLAVAAAINHDQRKYEPIDAVDQVSCRPDFAIGCYSGYLTQNDKDEVPEWIRIAPDTPPIFLAHAHDDSTKVGGSMPQNSVVMYLALKRANVPVEVHIYASGNHDFGVRQHEQLLPRTWPSLCVNWLKSYDLYTPKP